MASDMTFCNTAQGNKSTRVNLNNVNRMGEREFAAHGKHAGSDEQFAAFMVCGYDQ
jgi:hypothetical protein